MLKQVKFSDCIGKVIKKTALYWHDAYIVFEDDTFAYLTTEEGSFDDDPSVIVDRTFLIDPWSGNKPIELGIYTKDEQDAKHKEHTEIQEKIERGNYERLKAKFEESR